MQIKKAGFLTKIVILTLLIAATVSLLRLRTQIQEAQVELEDKRLQVAMSWACQDLERRSLFSPIDRLVWAVK